MTGAITLPAHECKRCGYVWIASPPDSIPIRCANPACRSPYYNTPRRNLKIPKEKNSE